MGALFVVEHATEDVVAVPLEPNGGAAGTHASRGCLRMLPPDASGNHPSARLVPTHEQARSR
jgi:hypothetical protein